MGPAVQGHQIVAVLFVHPAHIGVGNDGFGVINNQNDPQLFGETKKKVPFQIVERPAGIGGDEIFLLSLGKVLGHYFQVLFLHLRGTEVYPRGPVIEGDDVLVAKEDF